MSDPPPPAPPPNNEGPPINNSNLRELHEALGLEHPPLNANMLFAALHLQQQQQQRALMLQQQSNVWPFNFPASQLLQPAQTQLIADPPPIVVPAFAAAAVASSAGRGGGRNAGQGRGGRGGRGGAGPGVNTGGKKKHFSDIESKLLLRLAKQLLPPNMTGWEKVAESYNEELDVIDPGDRLFTRRKADQLSRKWKQWMDKPKTGETQPLDDVVEALEIQEMIYAKSGSNDLQPADSTLSDDEIGEDTGTDGSLEEGIVNSDEFLEAIGGAAPQRSRSAPPELGRARVFEVPTIAATTPVRANGAAASLVVPNPVVNGRAIISTLQAQTNAAIQGPRMATTTARRSLSPAAPPSSGSSGIANMMESYLAAQMIQMAEDKQRYALEKEEESRKRKEERLRQEEDRKAKESTSKRQQDQLMNILEFTIKAGISSWTKYEKGKKKKRRRRRKRGSNNDESSDDENDAKRKHKKRKRHRESDTDDSSTGDSSSGDDDDNDDCEGKRKKRKQHSRKRESGTDDGNNENDGKDKDEEETERDGRLKEG